MPALKQNWPSWAALAATVVALILVVTRVGASDIGNNFAILVRMIMVLGLISGVIWARGELLPPTAIAPRGAVFLALSGLSAVVSWLVFLRALGQGPGASLALADKISLGVVVFALAVLLGPRIGLRGFFGIILVLSGAFIVAR